MYISFAIFLGLCLSVMESRGEVSECLKTFIFIFWGFFSYIWRYCDTTFRIQSLVYFVVIIMAFFIGGFSYNNYDVNPFIWGGCCCRWM